MRLLSTWKAIVLLLGLLAGQTALAVHEADIAHHDEGEVCQVCLLGSASAGSAPAQPVLLPPALGDELPRVTPRSVVTSERLRVRFARGPPTSV